jgi:hypothetical protein
VQTKTYQTLFTLVQSLAGVNKFTSEEESYIINFTNRRFRQAYDASEYWPRYLVVGEARTVGANGVVPTNQTEMRNVGEFLRIHRNQPFNRNSEIEYNYFVTASGAHIMNIQPSNSTDVYVTYKLELPTIVFTSGVPLEYFYFMAHAVYADFLRMDGQNEKAIVEEQIAREYLDQELGKLDNINNNNSIGRKISTYVNRQSR